MDSNKILNEVFTKIKAEILADYRLSTGFATQPWYWMRLIDEGLIDLMKYVRYNEFNVVQKCQNLIKALILKGTKNGIYYACRCFFGEEVIVSLDETHGEEGFSLILYNVDNSLITNLAVANAGTFQNIASNEATPRNIAAYDTSSVTVSDIRSFLIQFNTIGNYIIQVTIDQANFSTVFFNQPTQEDITNGNF